MWNEFGIYFITPTIPHHVTLFPPTVGNGERWGKVHAVTLAYRGGLVEDGENDVGYWRSVTVKVRVGRRGGPRITRMGAREDFEGLGLDVEHAGVVEKMERSREFYADRAGKVGMEVMGRSLSSDVRNLELFASGGLSDSEDDDERSLGVEIGGVCTHSVEVLRFVMKNSLKTSFIFLVRK
ncbi:hypothetical protein TrCOL_g12183 [Triparma columacea]|uniref:Uncharacterized protein n=1 Tax=Triparma columacea TaxID=722753 RepID=A0A9W7G4I8_9STRA|nr:hypothetical protein TrCOL_g12183 [Triparma columacea]